MIFKRVVVCLVVFLASVMITVGQVSQAPSILFKTVDPSGACVAAFNIQNIANGTQFACVNGTWAALGGSGLGTVTSVGVTSTDLTVSGSPVTSAGSITLNLATTAVTPTTYGDSTHVGQFTVDSKGRLTAASNVAISAGTGGAALYTTTTFSATPTFSATSNTAQTFLITLTGNVTSSTFDASGITASGRPIVTFRILQDGSGGHTFVWPTNVLNHGTVDTTADLVSVQSFVWDGTNLQALGPLDVTNSATGAVGFPGSSSGVTYLQASAAATGTLDLPAQSGTATLTYTVSSGTSALGTSAISSATCASAVSTSATGVASTDTVTASFNGDPTAVTGYVPLTSGMLTIIVYPTSDHVNFKVCNNTSSSITPGAITLNWRVVR